MITLVFRRAPSAVTIQRAALGEIGDDLPFCLERGLVSVGACDGEVGPAENRCPAVTRPAVSEGTHVDDVVAVQRDQPVCRADEFLVVVVRPALP